MFAHMVGLPERLDRLPEPRMHPLKKGENPGPSLGRVQVRSVSDFCSTSQQAYAMNIALVSPSNRNILAIYG